jgi:cytochrome c oxidase cbb3-type subunit 4
MNPIWGHAIGVMIVVLMSVFIGIWIWVWRDRHKPVFLRMADLPMEDPVDADPARSGTFPKTDKGD